MIPADTHTSAEKAIRLRTDLWDLHPQGDYLRAQGGNTVPPPAYVNMVLTNKCNLRCEICGSQKFLDHTKTTRSHMPLDIFLRTAEIVFPVVSEVEFNSQGDPLLYPDIDIALDKVAEHRCQLRLQTNGTLFSEGITERILAMSGTVNISIDAVGPLFDEVRRNGVWSKAEPGIKNLLLKRNPARLAVQLYPTVTARTVGGMLDVVRWAAAHDVDSIEFHNYNPVPLSFERQPDPDDLRSSTDEIRSWLACNPTGMEVIVNLDTVNPRGRYRTEYACAIKGRFINHDPLYPIDRGHPWAAIRSLCMAPFRQLDFGIPGQASVCCRSQDVGLGEVTSVKAFADLWFGENYNRIRDSLTRDDKGLLPLPNCMGCIKYHAPEAGKDMVAVDYQKEPDHPRALRIEQQEISLLLVTRAESNGNVFLGKIPPGVDGKQYCLFEDDRPLKNAAEINSRENLKSGQYLIQEGKVYFSSIDSIPPIRNGRRYSLRKNL